MDLGLTDADIGLPRLSIICKCCFVDDDDNMCGKVNGYSILQLLRAKADCKEGGLQVGICTRCVCAISSENSILECNLHINLNYEYSHSSVAF